MAAADPTPKMSRDVAVIGAGAAGLVAARELRREGHRVVVYERGERVGGTWVYEYDHSSLYHSLRTNLPRQLMGFLDYPFAAAAEGGGGGGGQEGRDSRRFPGHGEVLRYLEDFQREFGLEAAGIIRFGTEVSAVAEEEEMSGRWRVTWRRVGADQNDACNHHGTEVHDAVVVCSGHYTQPNFAVIPGVDVWPGKQIHSKNYRVPEPFRDQVVVLIGYSASAFDISREVSKVAKEVHVSSRKSAPDGPIIKQQPGYDNMWLHSLIASANEDGTVVFQDGSSVLADIILHCTGYKYHFPFLETSSILTVDDNRVGPLYKHVFPPSHAPWLSFIGLPKLIPFPLCELQSKWVAGALSGRFLLPSEEQMLEDVNALYKWLDTIGHPKRHTHTLTYCSFEYTDWLAAECGCLGIEEWRKQMFEAARANSAIRCETYRDEWEDHHLIAQAQADFMHYFHRAC